MTLRIRYRPQALADLDEAAGWYEARGRGLGADFLRAFEIALAAVVRQPNMYPQVHGPARRAKLRRYPYNIYYIVGAEEILVVACMYGGRDPRRWQRRA
jgi:toxin ParE1/3/4